MVLDNQQNSGAATDGSLGHPPEFERFGCGGWEEGWDGGFRCREVEDLRSLAARGMIGRMAIIGINHVALAVKDVGRTVAFYTQVVGLEVIARPDFGFPGAWLRIGKMPYELHIIQVEDDAGVVASGSRGNHFAIEVKGMDEHVARIQGKTSWSKGPHLRPDGARQFFFQDPDGHTVELTEFVG